MLARDHYQRGMALHREGRLDAAVEAYGRALAAEPGFAEALNALGIALQQQGRLEDAIPHYRAALAAKPDYASASSNLGAALASLGDLAQALPWYRRAIELRPDHADAHYNLAKALHERGETEAALDGYRRATALDAGHASAWNNLGTLLREMGRTGEAVAAYRRAIAIRPDAAEIRYNAAMAQLECGDFAEGWAGYEARFAAGEVADRPFVQPRWRGEDIADKTLLVWAEQGFGDAIQFARLLPLAGRRAARLLFEVRPPLVRLFQGLAGVERVIVAGEPPPSFDLQVPLLSLPGILGIDAATIPVGVPYLSTEPAQTESWRARLAEERRPRIGLAWAGNPGHKNDANRSLPAATLAPLLDLPVAWYSLQPDAAPVAGIVPLGPELADFADSAAAMAGLDLIIAVDTAIAHLAGALGKPVWTLHPFAPDWRWLREREDSPWYPTMRLFRQRRPGDWPELIERVAAELRARFSL